MVADYDSELEAIRNGGRIRKWGPLGIGGPLGMGAC